jgi:hypothetical protein
MAGEEGSAEMALAKSLADRIEEGDAARHWAKVGAAVSNAVRNVEFDEELLAFDEGTQRIVYAAYPGEKPVVSGGREMTGWKKGEGKRWTAKLPTGPSRPWRFTQLFVDGKRQTRARLPDTDDWHKLWRAAGPSSETAFRFPDKTLQAWPNIDDVDVNLIPQYTWQSKPFPLRPCQ